MPYSIEPTDSLCYFFCNMIKPYCCSPSYRLGPHLLLGSPRNVWFYFYGRDLCPSGMPMPGPDWNFSKLKIHLSTGSTSPRNGGLRVERMPGPDWNISKKIHLSTALSLRLLMLKYLSWRHYDYSNARILCMVCVLRFVFWITVITTSNTRPCGTSILLIAIWMTSIC